MKDPFAARVGPAGRASARRGTAIGADAAAAAARARAEVTPRQVRGAGRRPTVPTTGTPCEVVEARRVGGRGGAARREPSRPARDRSESQNSGPLGYVAEAGVGRDCARLLARGLLAACSNGAGPKRISRTSEAALHEILARYTECAPATERESPPPTIVRAAPAVAVALAGASHIEQVQRNTAAPANALDPERPAPFRGLRRRCATIGTVESGSTSRKSRSGPGSSFEFRVDSSRMMIEWTDWRMTGADPTSPRLPPNQAWVSRDRWPLVGEREPRRDDSPWQVSIDGCVGERGTYDLERLRALARTEITIDLHCVTRWSKPDVTFAGVALCDLLERPASSRARASFVSSRAPMRRTARL